MVENQPPRLRKIIPWPAHCPILVFVPRILRFAKEEPGPAKVNVRHVQRHRPALGDFPGFGEIALRALGAGEWIRETSQPGAREEAANEVILVPSAPQTGHSALDLRSR